MGEPLTPDVEAGDYIEDDPEAWKAFVSAVNRYAPRYDGLRAQMGEDAGDILAGAILSYLAGQHGLYVRRAASQGDSLRKEAFLDAVDGCIAIVQQSLDTVRGEAENNPESRVLRTSVSAREHVIELLTGYRTWGLAALRTAREPTDG